MAFALICFSLALKAQQSTSIERIWDSDGINVEVGTNASFFINNFFNITGLDNPVFDDPFGFTGRLIRNDWALSGGINGQMFKLSSSELDSTRNRTSINNTINSRFGFEYQREIGKRWKFNVGLDYRYENQRSLNEFLNGFEKVTSETASNTHGFGPTMGLQFYISPRVSLFTQSGAFYLFGKSVSQNTFEINSRNNTKTTSETSEVRFVLPTSIFVAIQL